MRFRRAGEHRRKTFALVCVALIWRVWACQGNAGQLVNSAHEQASSRGNGIFETPGSLQVARQFSTPVKPGATVTQGTSTPPGPVPHGLGSIPAAFPRYFSFGVLSPPATASALDDMRTNNGAAITFRYQYLTGGVNAGRGWETWQQPAGQFANYYMQESAQHGYMPTFVYYEICLSNGPHPSDYCGGHYNDQGTTNLASPLPFKPPLPHLFFSLLTIHPFCKPLS